MNHLILNRKFILALVLARRVLLRASRPYVLVILLLQLAAQREQHNAREVRPGFLIPYGATPL